VETTPTTPAAVKTPLNITFEPLCNNGVPQLKATRVGNDWPTGHSAGRLDENGYTLAFDGRMRVDFGAENHILTEAEPTFTFDWPMDDGEYETSAYASFSFFTHSVENDRYWGWDLLGEPRMNLPEGCVAPVVTDPPAAIDYDATGTVSCSVTNLPSMTFTNDGRKAVEIGLSVHPGREYLSAGGQTMAMMPGNAREVQWTAYVPGTDTVVDSGTLTNPC
jgi:hypothetical protein